MQFCLIHLCLMSGVEISSFMLYRLDINVEVSSVECLQAASV